nr:PREDICTED: melanotransferrin [Bemisia tabaci]
MYFKISGLISCLLLIWSFVSVNAQANDFKNSSNIVWCTSSLEEQYKCLNFSLAVNLTKSVFEPFYLSCYQAFNKEECMSLLDQEKADLTSLDAGEVFVGGRYHSLVPIMQEVYPENMRHFYSVAAVKKGSLPDVYSIRNLRGKKACFAGVGTLAGWVIPVHVLMQHGGMEIIDCNNHVKSTINFFGPSCAVNSLIDKYNPIGDNSNKLCDICIGRIPGERCTAADPYAGFEGAFKCLVEAGEVAFLKHTTITEMTATNLNFLGVNPDEFELLCLDGSRAPVSEYRNCNWGASPSFAVVTTSAKTFEIRQKYIKFLQNAARTFGGEKPTEFFYTTSSTTTQTYDWNQDFNNPNFNQPSEATIPNTYSQNNRFHLFSSAPFYGTRHNLMFQDSTMKLAPLQEADQTYSGFLGPTLEIIMAVRDCPVKSMRLCVTSDPEMEKCIKMKIALKAQLLKPEMSCYKGHSQIYCMKAIQEGLADVAVFDAGDVYTAGLHYSLVPFISEVYNLGKPEYYVVAVAKEEDPDTELTYLKGKFSCHPGIYTGAGWIIPLAYLISNGWIRPYGCDSIRAAAEYFTKSCVPGAISLEYNDGVPYDNMCGLCHGASYRYCKRDHSEDYYGYTGALRCLVEGGGNVAFVKHTTVLEVTDGKRKEWWARNTLNEDFELLCPDGTRSTIQDYMRCNMGKVKANAIVTRGGNSYNLTELNAYINLFIYAQQFYGRKDQDEFNFAMFYSTPPYSDLIFQDAAQQLEIIPPELRWYSDYLGPDFMRARRIVDCHAGASQSAPSLLFISFWAVAIFVFFQRGG